VSTNHKNLTQPDLRRFDENRGKFPVDDLRKYAGQAVAFSSDGTRIVAHGEDFLTVWNQLKANGVDPSQFVWEDLPALDAEDSLL
jgi:hypothetical protein